jgi:hypothetical protein
MKSDSKIFRSSPHLSTEQLLNYLRGSLSGKEKHEVESHFTDCELCSDALEGLRKLDKESSMLRISDELHKMARSRRVKSRKIFSQLDLISLFAVIFLVLFLIAIAFLMFR